MSSARPPQTAFPFLPLFVPADRPERIEKASRSGADAVIVDLEDAVANDRKDAARQALVRAAAAMVEWPVPLFVRINGERTASFEADLAALDKIAPDGIVLPKAEEVMTCERLRSRFPGASLVGLIETPLGLARLRELAPACDRIAFGSLDFAQSIGARHERSVLTLARQEIVLASAIAGLPGPLDGVTVAIADETACEDDAFDAASLGFAGKLLIHPRQIQPALRGFAPTPSEVERARAIIDAAGGKGGAKAVADSMVDAPVLQWARSILTRAENASRVRDGS